MAEEYFKTKEMDCGTLRVGLIRPSPERVEGPQVRFTLPRPTNLRFPLQKEGQSRGLQQGAQPPLGINIYSNILGRRPNILPHNKGAEPLYYGSLEMKFHLMWGREAPHK